MAGYMSVLLNNIYDGRMTNGTGAAVANGIILKANATGTALVLPGSADAAFKCTAVEKTTIYGDVAADEILVNATGDTQYYFVENQFDINDSEAYDTTAYTTAAGEELRAHPIHAGERFYVSGTIAAGTAVTLKADGTLGA